jgi:hypothetical protein
MLETTGPSDTALIRAPSTVSLGRINVLITWRGERDERVRDRVHDYTTAQTRVRIFLQNGRKAVLTSGPSSDSPAMQPYRVVHWVFSSNQL